MEKKGEGNNSEKEKTNGQKYYITYRELDAQVIGRELAISPYRPLLLVVS